jgi:hypothetical protein
MSRETVRALLMSVVVMTGCSSNGGSRPIVVRQTASVSPATATRLEITAVQDTTFTIAVRDFAWVSPGMAGIVVDPAKRDVLVARYRVVQRSATEATAMITGQTTKVSIDQAALLQPPAPRAESKKAFWSGAGIGLLLGAVVGGIVGVSSK